MHMLEVVNLSAEQKVAKLKVFCSDRTITEQTQDILIRLISSHNLLDAAFEYAIKYDPKLNPMLILASLQPNLSDDTWKLLVLTAITLDLNFAQMMTFEQKDAAQVAQGVKNLVDQDSMRRLQNEDSRVQAIVARYGQALDVLSNPIESSSDLSAVISPRMRRVLNLVTYWENTRRVKGENDRSWITRCCDHFRSCGIAEPQGKEASRHFTACLYAAVQEGFSLPVAQMTTRLNELYCMVPPGLETWDNLLAQYGVQRRQQCPAAFWPPEQQEQPAKLESASAPATPGLGATEE